MCHGHAHSHQSWNTSLCSSSPGLLIHLAIPADSPLSKLCPWRFPRGFLKHPLTTIPNGRIGGESQFIVHEMATWLWGMSWRVPVPETLGKTWTYVYKIPILNCLGQVQREIQSVGSDPHQGWKVTVPSIEIFRMSCVGSSRWQKGCAFSLFLHTCTHRVVCCCPAFIWTHSYAMIPP